MPRKPIEQVKLENIVADLVFVPSAMQRKTKAKYWTRVKTTPFTDGDPTLAEVNRVVRDQRLAKWWQEPGFIDWFMNKEEFKERMEFIANMALDTLEEIISNPDASGSARIAATKMAIEVAGKMPSKEIMQYADAQINEMSAAQLKEFIKNNAPRLIEEEKVIEVEAKEVSSESD